MLLRKLSYYLKFAGAVCQTIHSTKSTMIQLQEYLVRIILRRIETYFDNYDIPHTTLPDHKLPTGERRGLVEEYYTSIDWTNPRGM